MSVYLHNLPLNEALSRLLTHAPLILKEETIRVDDSLHRVSSQSVIAKVSSPSYNASAMDGIMVNAHDTEEATETNPVTLTKGAFAPVNTGNPIVKPFNAVIKIEDVIDLTEDHATIIEAASAYQHVRPIGEDIVEKTTLIPKHHVIRAVDIAALKAGGVTTINVYQNPRIVFIPTGDEIIRETTALAEGKILDSNSALIEQSFKAMHLTIDVDDVCPDDYETMKARIETVTKAYDLVLIGAGSSAGSKDYVKQIVETLGEVFVHGVAIKPGKPSIIGKINQATVLGLPGYPVSTYLAFTLFLKPLIYHAFKQPLPTLPSIQAKLTKRIVTSLNTQEYIRVKINTLHQQVMATPLARGAGMMMSVVEADGLLIVPQDQEGYEAQDTVNVALLKPLSELEHRLTLIGSHDILIDELHTLMRDQSYQLSSTHIGSFGGVMAIKQQECHLAPVHLIDEDGAYNHHLITQYLDQDYALIKGVGRIQGLYTKPGNPKNITSLEDLTRQDVRFVNRQRGSGTRMFLDNHLKTLNLTPSKIEGYAQELPTHTMVASMVARGGADVGLGIESVARMFDLHFQPLGVEHYDFLVHQKTLDLPIVKAFIQTLQSDAFKQRLTTLQGYTTEAIGTIIKP